MLLSSKSRRASLTSIFNLQLRERERERERVSATVIGRENRAEKIAGLGWGLSPSPPDCTPGQEG